MRNSLVTVASRHSKRAQAACSVTGWTAAARQLNCALYRIAITQSRYHPGARAYLERKQAEGKSRREAIRCLKRTLARVVFNTLKASPALT
jgi:hypothetical protein